MNKHAFILQQKLNEEHGFCHLFVVGDGYMFQVNKKGKEPEFRTYPFDMSEYHVKHGVKHFKDKGEEGERRRTAKKAARKSSPSSGRAKSDKS